MTTPSRAGLAAALIVCFATAIAAPAGAAGRPSAPAPRDFDVRAAATPAQPSLRAGKAAQSRNRLRSSLGPSAVLDSTR